VINGTPFFTKLSLATNNQPPARGITSERVLVFGIFPLKVGDFSEFKRAFQDLAKFGLFGYKNSFGLFLIDKILFFCYGSLLSVKVQIAIFIQSRRFWRLR
jgi:hypothetical protein